MSSTLNQQIIDTQMEYVAKRKKEEDQSVLEGMMEVTGDDEYDLGITTSYFAKVVYGMKHF